MNQSILSRFPYVEFKGYERPQIESIVEKVVVAYDLCMRENRYDDDEEQLIDDIFDIIRPADDDEILLLRVIDTYLAVL